MGKILVADDEFGVRRLLVETFLEDQYELETAENGEEAVRLFITYKPDLILLDMKMPRMNGIEALRQIRALDSRVAVIIMTAYGDHRDRQQAKALGIVAYIDKPFDLIELREQVREIFDELSEKNIYKLRKREFDTWIKRIRSLTQDLPTVEPTQFPSSST